MAISISIKTDFPAVQARLKQLQADVGQRAMASALNKSIDLAKTQMTREIPAEFNVSAGFVRQRLRVSKATARGGRVVLTARLAASRNGRFRSANLIKFVEQSVTLAQARKRAKAGTLGELFVKIKRKGGKKSLGKLRFIGNKGRTVFERVPGTTMAARSKFAGTKHAQKIKGAQTIDVGQMFNTRRINGRVVATLRERFPAIFENEARFFLARFSAAR